MGWRAKASTNSSMDMAFEDFSHTHFDYINFFKGMMIVIGLPKTEGKSRINYVPLVKYTWTPLLRSKDETPEVLKDFLTMIQRNLQAPVISVRTDRGTEFLNKTLNAFFKEEGIEHQTSTPRTPEQNGVVERRNRTLVEAARHLCTWPPNATAGLYDPVPPCHGKLQLRRLELSLFFVALCCTQSFTNLSRICENGISNGSQLKEESSAKAKYVGLSASCCSSNVMRTQAIRLRHHTTRYNKIPLYCDSQSAIAISCNPVQHSRTKHIHTRYHFIKEQVENGIIELYFVRTEYQLADMFTKALPEERFQYLVRRIGMRCLTPAELEVLTKESA
ncbi:retrovirus-related pol polyprotein from transposon TNT 1-94 [Tanacetum coccineum]